MPFKLIAALLVTATLLPLLLASGSGHAQPPAARDPLDVAFTRMVSRPNDAELALEYARLAAARGQPRAAISALERALRYNPQLDSLRLELASLHMAAGAPDIAAVYAQEALAAPEIPSDVALRANTLLAGAERGSARSLFEGSIFVGARYDSNATQATTLGTVAVFSPLLGLVSVTPNNRGRSDASGVFGGQLSHRLDLGLQREGVWETNASAFRQDFAQVSHNYDLAILQVDTGPRIGIAEFGDASLAVRPFVSASYAAYGARSFSTPYGAGVSMVLRLPPRWTVEASAQGRYAKFYNSAFRPTVGLYSGAEYTLSTTVGYAVSSSARIAATLFYYDAGARATFYERGGPGGSVTAATDVTVFGLPTSGSLRAGLRQITYGGADPFIDPTQRRDDTVFDAGASLVVPVGYSLSAVLQYDYVRQRSRYDIYRFEDHAVTAGFRFGF